MLSSNDTQCRLNTWTRWAVALWVHEHRDPMLIFICCVRHVIYCLNTNFVGSTNTINICWILSTFYIFIPVSGCVGRGSQCIVFPGAYNAVKTALMTQRLEVRSHDTSHLHVLRYYIKRLISLSILIYLLLPMLIRILNLSSCAFDRVLPSSVNKAYLYQINKVLLKVLA